MAGDADGGVIMRNCYWVFWTVDGEIINAYFDEKQAAQVFISAMEKLGVSCYLNRYAWTVEMCLD